MNNRLKDTRKECRNSQGVGLDGIGQNSCYVIIAEDIVQSNFLRSVEYDML